MSKSKESNIIIPDFGPSEEQIEFRKALAHAVFPNVVDHIVSNVESVDGLVAENAAALTVLFVDALIKELED